MVIATLFEHFFNKIPKKSSKNSANTSANILKSNQSVETIFKKKQCAQHLKKESNLINLDKAGEKSINLLIQKGHEASAKWLESDKIKVFFIVNTFV